MEQKEGIRFYRISRYDTSPWIVWAETKLPEIPSAEGSIEEVIPESGYIYPDENTPVWVEQLPLTIAQMYRALGGADRLADSKKLRRRIEDALRKTASTSNLERIADILGVRVTE